MEMLFARAARPPVSLSKLSLKAPDDPGPDNSENFRGHSLSVIDGRKAGLDKTLRRLV